MGYLADPTARLDRGDRVLIVGRLQVSTYQTRDGETRTGYDVWADEVVNLSRRVQPTSIPDREGPATAKAAGRTRVASPMAEVEEVEVLPLSL